MIIPLDLGENSYDIVLERGVLGRAAELLDLSRRVLIVTDSGVPAEYAQQLREQALAAGSPAAKIVTIPQGEGSKVMANFELLLKEMLEASFTRKDCAVAVGGGVVGDLTAFAASCYMRGIDFYNIPTTLLSQVDSSIGGKTAIDFCGVKNIVGSFFQPKKVLIDPDCLKTLPRRQVSAGLAEAIKMSLTSDAGLFEIIKNSEDLEKDLPEIIRRSLVVKRDVVQQDPKEKGLRKILNFGHTIGHAIEACSAEQAAAGCAMEANGAEQAESAGVAGSKMADQAIGAVGGKACGQAETCGAAASGGEACGQAAAGCVMEASSAKQVVEGHAMEASSAEQAESAGAVSGASVASGGEACGQAAAGCVMEASSAKQVMEGHAMEASSAEQAESAGVASGVGAVLGVEACGEEAAPLLHGECVALGMLPMCSQEVREELVPVLEKYDLPTDVSAHINVGSGQELADVLMPYILHDKKMQKGSIAIVRVEKPGSFVMEDVDPESLRLLM